MRAKKSYAMLAIGALFIAVGVTLVAVSATRTRGQPIATSEPHDTVEVQRPVPPGDHAEPPEANTQADPAQELRSLTPSIRGVAPAPDLAIIDRELDEEDRRAKERIAELQAHPDVGDQLADEILKGRRKQELTDRAKALIQQMVGEGTPAVPLLAQLYQRQGPVQGRTVVINALKEVGSDDAAEALFARVMDPGRDSRTIGRRAVKALAAITDNSYEIARCLESPEPVIRDAATRALWHRDLSADAVEAIDVQFRSSSWVSQQLAAAAFKTDKTSRTAARKVDLLLLRAMEIDTRVSDKDHVPSGMPWTPREMVKVSFISALSRMPGADESLLSRYRTANQTQRQFIAIALGNRKHQEFRPDLVTIIRTSKDGVVRTMAVRALYHVGAEDDIGLLRELVRSDPFRRPVDPHPGSTKGPEDDWPVRYEAKRVLTHLQDD